jgi:hypothetical protein
MADDFILNTLGFKTEANKHSNDPPELQAIDARLDAHTAQRNSEGLITKGVNALFKTVADGDDKSEKKLEELRAQVLADLQSGNKAAIAALQPDIQRAVQADIQACQGDAVRNGVSSFVASTLVAASMFVRGPRGRALSMTLNAANDVHTSDGVGGMALDAAVGAAKGYALSRTFETLGAKNMSAPAKGVAIGLASRLEDNLLTASNYRDQNGGLDIGAGVNNTLHETFNPFSAILDAGTFGVGHVAASGVNASLKGALEKNPVAANVFTGFSIGLVSGMNGEFAQETSNPNGSVNYGRVAWKGLESGLSNALSAFGGAKLEQTSTFSPGADLRHPGTKPTGSIMLPDATDAGATRTAPVRASAPSTPVVDVAPPVLPVVPPVVGESPIYDVPISKFAKTRTAGVVNAPEAEGGPDPLHSATAALEVTPTAAVLAGELHLAPDGSIEPAPMSPMAVVESLADNPIVVPAADEPTDVARPTAKVIPFAAPAASEPHSGPESSDGSTTRLVGKGANDVVERTDDRLMAAAARSDDPLRATKPKSNDEVRIGSISDFRYLGTDPTGKQAIVAYGDKRTLAASGPVIAGSIESNGFRRVTTQIPVEVNGVETDLPLYTKEGKSRIYAAVPTPDGRGFTERAVKGAALRDVTDLGTTDLENGPPGRADAWRNAQFLRGTEISGTNLEVVGHDADGNDVVVRDKTKTPGSEPSGNRDDLNHYRAVVYYNEHGVPEVRYTPIGSTTGELYTMEPDFDNGDYRATLQDDIKVISREDAGLRPLADPPKPMTGENAHSTEVMTALWPTVDHLDEARGRAFTELVAKNSAFIDRATIEAEIQGSTTRSEASRREAQLLVTRAYKSLAEQGLEKMADAFKPGSNKQSQLDFQIWALNHGLDAVELLRDSKQSAMRSRFSLDNPNLGRDAYGPNALIKDSIDLIGAGRDVLDAATPPPKPAAEARLEMFLRTKFWGVSPEARAAGAERPEAGRNPDFNTLRQPLIDFANSINNGNADPAVAVRVINQAFDNVGIEIGKHLVDRAVGPNAPREAQAQLINFLAGQPENVRDVVRAHDVSSIDGVSLSGHINYLADQASPARLEEAKRLLQAAVAPDATRAEKEAFAKLVETDGSHLRTPLENFSRLNLDAESGARAQELIRASWLPIEKQAADLLVRASSPKGTLADHLAFMEFVRQHGPDSLQTLVNEFYTPDATGRNRRQRETPPSADYDPNEETRLIARALTSRPGVVEEPRVIPTDAELAAMSPDERDKFEHSWSYSELEKQKIRNRAEDIHNLRASLEAAVAAVPGGVWPATEQARIQLLNDPAIRNFMQAVYDQKLLANGSDPKRPTVPVDRDMFDYAAAKAGQQPDSAYMAVVGAAYGNLNVDVPGVHPKQAVAWEFIRRAITESDPSPARQDELESMLVEQLRLDPLIERRARELQARMYDGPAKATLATALDGVSPQILLDNPYDFHDNFYALSERFGQMSLPQFAEVLELGRTQGIPNLDNEVSEKLFNNPAVREALQNYLQNPADPAFHKDLEAIKKLLSIDYDVEGKAPEYRRVLPSRLQQLANVYADPNQPDGMNSRTAVYAGLPESVVALLRQQNISPQPQPSGTFGSTPTASDQTILNSAQTTLMTPSTEYVQKAEALSTVLEKATLSPPNAALGSSDALGLLRLMAEDPAWAQSMVDKYGRVLMRNNADWNKQHFELAALLSQAGYADVRQVSEVLNLLEQSRKARSGDSSKNEAPDPAHATALFRQAVTDAEQLADRRLAQHPDLTAKPTYDAARAQFDADALALTQQRNVQLKALGQPLLDETDPAVLARVAQEDFDAAVARLTAIKALLNTLRDQPQQGPPGRGPQGPRQGRGGPRWNGPPGQQPPGGQQPPPGGKVGP